MLYGGRILGLEKICGDGVVEKFTSECPGILEAPNFDKEGNLWLISARGPGAILRVTPDGHCSIVAKVPDGTVGLRFHKDGRLFGADHYRGLFWFDTKTHEVHHVTSGYAPGNFHGIDDLFFDSTGGLYITDAFGSSVLNPVGQLFYMAPTGELRRLIHQGLAFPNGVVLSPDEKRLYIDDWGTNRILAVPVTSPGVVNIDRAYVFAYLNGGHGPDSMTADAEGNIYAAHFGAGEVVVFDPNGFYYGGIQLPTGLYPTNVAFHGGYLYITEVEHHTIWRVKTKIPGMKLFGDG